jgi:hypothetical protein
MQGVRKLLRAAAIVILPVVGILIVLGSSDAVEAGLGIFLILFAIGLIATWFW